jgi:hypothetical protein
MEVVYLFKEVALKWAEGSRGQFVVALYLPIRPFPAKGVNGSGSCDKFPCMGHTLGDMVFLTRVNGYFFPANY